MLRELWRKSCGCWHFLQLADPAIIGKETMKLQSLTKKVACICAHSGIPVKCFLFVRYVVPLVLVGAILLLRARFQRVDNEKHQ
jgi:hypothetical protein